MNCFITLPHPGVSDIYIFWHDNWYLIIRTIMLYVLRQQLKPLKQQSHITDIALFVCFDYKWKELSQLYLQWTLFWNKTNALHIHIKRVNKYTIQTLSTNTLFKHCQQIEKKTNSISLFCCHYSVFGSLYKYFIIAGHLGS